MLVRAKSNAARRHQQADGGFDAGTAREDDTPAAQHARQARAVHRARAAEWYESELSWILAAADRNHMRGLRHLRGDNFVDAPGRCDHVNA